MVRNSRTWICILIAILACANGILGVLYWRATQDASQSLSISSYLHLSPNVLNGQMEHKLINFIPLRRDLLNYMKDKEESVSLYFEYLPTGVSIGIHEKREYQVASLFKVPLVMSVLKKQERELWDPKETLLVLKSSQLDDRFGDVWKRGAGASLHIDEAMYEVLVHSDNTAARALQDHIQSSDILSVYDGLDIPFSSIDDQVVMTAKSYSSVLKALYFSSLLSPSHSEYVLSLLSKTPFSDKLVSAIPTGVPVAHKIGVYGENIFHDCGIIYLPHRPYILCMIVSEHEEKVRTYMHEVSQMVYTYLSSRSHTE